MDWTQRPQTAPQAGEGAQPGYSATKSGAVNLLLLCVSIIRAAPTVSNQTDEGVEFGADPKKRVSSEFQSGFMRSVLVLGGGLSSLSDSERSVTNFNEAVSWCRGHTRGN